MELNELVTQTDILREEHPGCGVEKLYDTLKPKFMGRDKFCEVFMELGYRVRRIKNYAKTTIPTWFNYPNLIEGMAVTRPYHVLQTDITYFDIDGRFYYLVFIIDVYTREILGYHVGDNMRTQCNIKALKMALGKIPDTYYGSMVHHSDRGSQYGSEKYTRILKDKGIRISMGEIAQDNAFAERINGTIKNEYLKLWDIPDFKALKKKAAKAVKHYNGKRLHLAFDNEYSPLGFKETLLDLAFGERPKMVVFSEGNYQVKEVLEYSGRGLQSVPMSENCPLPHELQKREQSK